MSYTIDTQRSKAIRKMMNNKTITIPTSEFSSYTLSNLASDIKVRFVNVDNGIFYVDYGVEVSYTLSPGITDYAKKRLPILVRNEVRSNSKVRKFFKLYLMNFGVKLSHIKSIKIKSNEAKS
jgi:hypothetical protein